MGAFLVLLFFYQILGLEGEEEHTGFSDLDSANISCAPAMCHTQRSLESPPNSHFILSFNS